MTNTTVTVTNKPMEISEETSGTSFSDTEGSSTETLPTTVKMKKQRAQIVMRTVMTKVQQTIMQRGYHT